MRMPIRLEDVDFTNGAMLGAVRLRGQWRFFTGFLAEWIMDYYAYDPTSNPADPDHQERIDHRREQDARLSADQQEDVGEFRDGLYQIDETNADAFCQAMEPWEVSPDDVRKWLPTLGEQTRWMGNLNIIIDFDEKLFVNGFDEVSIESYVPSGWRGVEDLAFKYLPYEIRSWWGDWIY